MCTFSLPDLIQFFSECSITAKSIYTVRNHFLNSFLWITYFSHKQEQYIHDESSIYAFIKIQLRIIPLSPTRKTLCISKGFCTFYYLDQILFGLLGQKAHAPKFEKRIYCCDTSVKNCRNRYVAVIFRKRSS